MSARGAGSQALRILHLRDTPRLCGPGKTILETVRRNPDADVVYHVGSFAEDTSGPFLSRFQGLCETMTLPPGKPGLPRAVARLASYARRERISLIHAHDFKSDLVAWIAGGLTGVPVITTAHGFTGESAKARWFDAMDARLLRRLDLVIVVSDAMRRQFESRGIPPARLRTVRNGIALDAWPFGARTRTLRSSLGLAQGALIVGHVGRLSLEKGQRALMRVFPEVLSAAPTARLVFVGEGPDDATLRATIAQLGLADRAFLLGHRTDIREVFGDLDLLVLSSSTEGLPNVVLEAMAAGVPVVATDVGGTGELVIDGRTGLLVRAGDDRALTRAVTSALADRAAASRRAAAAREHVEREFDFNGLISTTHEIYRGLLDARATSPGHQERRLARREPSR
jgi:glycosyltransferase involved in cell wall biosynthesis